MRNKTMIDPMFKSEVSQQQKGNSEHLLYRNIKHEKHHFYIKTCHVLSACTRTLPDHFLPVKTKMAPKGMESGGVLDIN